MVRIIVAALLLLSATAQAETMYRCVAKSGAVAYQDYPCGSNARQTGVAVFTPDPVPAYRPPARSASRSTGTARGASAVLHNVPLQTDRCARVRAERDAWENAVGLRRTFDDLRRWQDRVNAACN